MSIRFTCPSCNQPIEVDDAWATKLVACPYCRNTINAPEVSTFEPSDTVPMASPMDAARQPYQATLSQTDIPHYMPHAGADRHIIQDQHPNHLAIVALVLAIVAFVAVRVGMYLFVANASDLLGYEISDPAYQDQVMQDLMKKIPEMMSKNALPGWYIAYTFSILGGLMGDLAALICGGIAVSRNNRRGMAIASLIIAVVAFPLMCCGI